MTPVARYAVAWPQVGAVAAALVLAIAVLGQRPWQLWPLEGLSLSLLVAGVAWCLDDPTPEIARTTPRQLRWTLRPRSAGLAVPLVAWSGAVILLGGDMFGHRTDVLLHGYAAALATSGIVAWLRWRDRPQPGHTVAPVAVPLVLALALVRPTERWLPVFPYGPDAAWGRATWTWGAMAAAGCVLLVGALAEVHSR